MVDAIEVGGLRVAFERRGAGPPLVLLHGWPLDSREWRRQLDGLSDEFTVVAWDAPGAGRSSDPPDTFRLADWADCLAGFIAALGLERAHIAGLSWGGGLALELYRRHPATVRTLTLVSAGTGWGGGSVPPEVVEKRVQVYLRNSELPPDAWVPAWVATLLADRASGDMVDELTAILSDFHPVAMGIAIRAFADADLRDVLAPIDVPTLLLYGGEDVRAGRDVWEPLHARIRGSRLVVIPGAGHMLGIEAAERFDSEVRTFLRAVQD